MKRIFTRRYRVVVYMPHGMGQEHSSALTCKQAGIYFHNAMRRARSMPGMVVRVIPLIGGA